MGFTVVMGEQCSRKGGGGEGKEEYVFSPSGFPLCFRCMRQLFFGRTRRVRIQFFRYFIVGGTSAVVDLMFYGALLAYFGARLYLVWAFVAYMVGLVWNHMCCLLWVFESRHERWKEFFMVFLIALGGLFWTELLLWIGVDFLHGHPFFTKPFVLLIVLIWNFGMRKTFVFH